MAEMQRSKESRRTKSTKSTKIDIESGDEASDLEAKETIVPLPRVVVSSEDSTYGEGTTGQTVDDKEKESSSKAKTIQDQHARPLEVERTSTTIEEPIFQLAWDCDELIDRCLHQAQDSNVQAALEQYRRSFDAWSKYLGVFAERKTNLDRRLRQKTGILDIVIRLLLILKQNLAKCESKLRLSSD